MCVCGGGGGGEGVCVCMCVCVCVCVYICANMCMYVWEEESAVNQISKVSLRFK